MISKIGSLRLAAFVGAVLGLLSATVGCAKNDAEATPTTASGGVASTPPPPAYDQNGKRMQPPPPGMTTVPAPPAQSPR